MLYVEGKADRVLARKLGIPGRDIGDGEDKGGVLRRVAQQEGSMGLVDEDPGSPQSSLLNRMEEVTTDDLRQLGLRVYQHGPTGNKVVVLCPRLEEWLIRSAGDAGLDLSHPSYNLPNSSSSLHRVINRDLRKLERLIDDLLAADAPRLRRLGELLTG